MPNQLSRRRVVAGYATAGALSVSGAAPAPPPAIAPGGYPVYDAGKNGVPADGKTLGGEAIQTLIDAAARQRGGVVYFGPGEYLTGTIALRENVTLYLEAGAVIRASGSRSDYTQQCLIYAENASRPAIRGRGVVDGNGPAFWKRSSGRWGKGDWRPQRLVQFVNCPDALIEGVTFRNSPAWTLHPVGCERMTIHGISILNGITRDDRGPNTDGIDPDSCTGLRISDCFVQSGDDCIVLKATRRAGGSGGCRDVTVTNCVLTTHETALKIGSETFGEFYNVTFSNCAIRNAGCGIGLWMRDGGVIDGWTVNNISMTLDDGGQPIYMTAYPRELLADNGTRASDDTRVAGVVRNVHISEVLASGDGCVFISGMDRQHIEGVTLSDIRIHMRGGKEKKLHANPPYPFPLWGHHNSPYDIFCRNVDNLKLRNVEVVWGAPEKPEWGGALRCRNVNGLEIDGLSARQATGSDAAVISLENTSDALIHNCRPPRGTGVFVHVGHSTANVALMSNDLGHARQAASFDPAARREDFFETANRQPRG